ncbi:SURF1 family protein [Legionella feeleii]|uniref:SURF1-like protein n=1 Tax=Legionella feeleii TaxID=453 RepID=A0A0W0TK43_9GAMM|nr:SURF1 family protein [Legionella feeleii]KTC95983.1 SURF1 family protein [Legionella feeleii]SPX60257.1 Uncharacterized conserved protein [Legionella feeleii]
MVSLTCFNRRFTPGWRMTVLALLAILLFVRLGFWQLTRAEEKKQMLAAEAALARQSPTLWQPGMVNPQQYQPVSIKGHYLPDILLLDNQHYQHQFGYNVLTLFKLDSGNLILIDRGWIKGDVTRRTLPQVQIPTSPAHLTGRVYYPAGKDWVLGPSVEKKGKITIVEQLNTKLIGRFLHKSVYPFIIRLNKSEADGYVREWAVVAMPPERHYAYALQWFVIAFVVLILFVALNLKKTYEDEQA